MPQCAVIWCHNYSKKVNKQNSDVTYHRFPNNPGTKQKWIVATGRYNWLPQKHDTICSDHFEATGFTKRNNTSTRLSPHAIPTLKLHPIVNEINEESAREAGPSFSFSKVNQEADYNTNPKFEVEVIKEEAQEVGPSSNSPKVKLEADDNINTTIKVEVIEEDAQEVDPFFSCPKDNLEADYNSNPKIKVEVIVEDAQEPGSSLISPEVKQEPNPEVDFINIQTFNSHTISNKFPRKDVPEEVPAQKISQAQSEIKSKINKVPAKRRKIDAENVKKAGPCLNSPENKQAAKPEENFITTQTSNSHTISNKITSENEHEAVPTESSSQAHTETNSTAPNIQDTPQVRKLKLLIMRNQETITRQRLETKRLREANRRLTKKVAKQDNIIKCLLQAKGGVALPNPDDSDDE